MLLFEAFRTLKSIYHHPLNARFKINALLNFLKWQLGTAILNKEVIIPWVDDCSFIASKGDRGLTGNIYSGLMELEEMLFLLHVLPTNWQFIDVGANLGAFTLLASKVIGANSVAFEPVPNTVKLFRKQISLNCLSNKVTIFIAAVSDKPGKLYFTNENSTTNHFSLSDMNKTPLKLKC